MTCRRLDVTITRQDLQEMPEWTVAVWDAVAQGESQAQAEKAAHT